MSQVDKPAPLVESELSQILAHAHACRDAFGPYMGAVVLLVTIMKARRGAIGITTAASLVLTVFYRAFWMT